MRKKPCLPAFTLVELLVVITVIALLAALVLRIAAGVKDKAVRSRAEGEIEAISSALERYKTDHGEYPSGKNTDTIPGGDNGFLYQALYPSDPNAKVYYEFPKNMTVISPTSTNIIDPWGNAYGYQYPGDATENRNGTNFFDLWSTANKPDNPSAWIKNW